jgi:flagellar hook-associated protein 1 FlgK
MPPLLASINTALRAVLAHQQAMQVIEHNVANANTPGYHRQEAVLRAGIPFPGPSLHRSGYVGQMGGGVDVERIRRFSLEMTDARFRKAGAEAARWETEASVLSQVQSVLAETSEDGLAPKLDAFWAGWQALSADPGNRTLRIDLQQRARDLVSAFHRRAVELDSLRLDQNTALIQRAEAINTAAESVAQLNAEISRVLSVGDQPNDLMDERDRRLDELGRLAGATSSLQDNGEVLVSIGGHALVVGHGFFGVEAVPDPGNEQLVALTWEDGQAFSPPGGEIAGLLDARNEIILQQKLGLDDLAAALAGRVNTLHRTGYGLNGDTGLDFFDGTTALGLRVSTDVVDPASIATASAADSPGDGSLAAAIAAVQRELLMGGGTATLGQAHLNLVGSLGLATQSAQNAQRDYTQVADSLQAQRESVTGVSLDEEAARLVQAQRAFQAAARMLTAIDEMLDRVINGMGVVGR